MFDESFKEEISEREQDFYFPEYWQTIPLTSGIVDIDKNRLIRI